MARVYRSQQQLRRLLVDYGVQVLLDEGMGEPLTLPRVFARIEAAHLPRVTKGSVIGANRLWASQSEYRIDVELEAINRWAEGSMVDSVTANTTREILDAADLTTFEGRQIAWLELLRRVSDATMESNRAHPLWSVVVAIWGRVVSSPATPEGQRLGEALERGRARAHSIGVEVVFRPVGPIIGMRGRDGLWSADEGYRMAAFATTALGKGMVLDQRFGEPEEPLMLPTGPQGALLPWSTYAVAARGVIEQFLELDPEWRFPGGSAKAPD